MLAKIIDFFKHYITTNPVVELGRHITEALKTLLVFLENRALEKIEQVEREVSSIELPAERREVPSIDLAPESRPIHSLEQTRAALLLEQMRGDLIEAEQRVPVFLVRRIDENTVAAVSVEPYARPLPPAV